MWWRRCRTSPGSMADPTTPIPDITLAIVLRNAGRHLDHLLDDVFTQSLARDRFELLIVDGESEDQAVPAARARLSQATDLRWRILDNPDRVLAAGWNLVLRHAQAPLSVRVDVHARIGSTFLETNFKASGEGRDIVGGPVVTVAPEDAPPLLVSVERSRFAGGAAAFRREGEPRFVDTLAYAAYPRHVFETVGGFDPRLVRNQDNEMHARIRSAGFRFRYDPSIRSRHGMRADWSGLWAQKFRNGYWIAPVSAIRPGSFSLRHLAPFAFVVTLMAAVGVGFAAGRWSWAAGLVLLHLIAGTIMSASEPRPQGLSRLGGLLRPPAFLLTHLVYGCGTLCGLLDLPRFFLRTRSVGGAPALPARKLQGADA